jgi:hypothetical protein
MKAMGLKSNELRIGNKALWINKEITIDSGDIALCDIVGCEFSGIPLTEEWLIEFGFKCKSYGYGKDEWKQWKFNGYSLNGFTCIMSGVELKHVNQLQNLYFALTSEELTIKE